MEISKEEKKWLKKNNPLLYFLIFRVIEKNYRLNLIMLFNFTKTASGYLDKMPIDQDSYFDFKDRYYKAKEGYYLNDGFIGELYPLVCESSFSDKSNEFFWHNWIEDFFSIKDLELSPIYFNKEEELYYYLNLYNALAYSFAFLSGWDSELNSSLCQFLRIYKHQELLLRAEKDATLSRRYLPLLDSSLLSFSYTEFMRKTDSYKRLIEDHLFFEDKAIEELEKEIPFFPKKRRAISYVILKVLKKRKLKMSKKPEKVFLKPQSFSISLGNLEVLYFWYRLKVLFQKKDPLKKGRN